MTTPPSPLEHPLVRDSIGDARLRQHHAFHVLVQLCAILPADGTQEPVYKSSLALSLKVDRGSVRRAMRILVKRGYLTASDHVDPRGVRAYGLRVPDVGSGAPHPPAGLVSHRHPAP